MYTKEQLTVAKDILLNLISDRRELSFAGCGICFNLTHKMCHLDIDGYEIVNYFGHMWPSNTFDQNNEDDYGYVCVERDYGFGLWEGTNLSLRMDLMKFIVSKIDELLEGM